MKVIYICECCEDTVDQVEFDESDVNQILDDSLTGEVAQDIIKMQLGVSRRYVNTICNECLAAINWDEINTTNHQQLIN